MPGSYEELAFHRTPLGELLLRRRKVPGLGDGWIHEVKLADELLMSSLLTASERALADLSLAAVDGDELAVLVGGLGLGETADAALATDRVRSLTVVEILPEVVAWHRDGLVPLGARLTGDPRVTILVADFFRALGDLAAVELSPPERGYDAVLVDIDHAPDSWLHPSHAGFYGEEGIASAAARVAPGGVFGFWSSGRPDEDFRAGLAGAFADVTVHEIEVENPLLDESQVDTIYVARRR